MDQAVVEYDGAIFWYVQPATITPQQYAGDLAAKSCKVAEFYFEKPLQVDSTEGADSSIHHDLSHCWAQNPHAEFTDITFQAYSLLSIQ